MKRRTRFSMLLCLLLIFTMSFSTYAATDETDNVSSSSQAENNVSSSSQTTQNHGDGDSTVDSSSEPDASKSDDTKNPAAEEQPVASENAPDVTESPAANAAVSTATTETPVQQVIDGKKYLVYSDNSHYKGWFDLSADWRVYCNPDEDGAMIVGRVAEISTSLYLFDTNGILCKGSGTPVVNGAKYWLNNGIAQTGWLNMGNWRMYFDPSDGCKARTGLATVEEKRYIFDDNGVLYAENGTPVINGHKYWFTGDGSLRTGWLILGGWKMYFDPTDCAGKTGLTEIDGKHYIFDDNGVMQTASGTPVINNKKYWINPDGSLSTGWLRFGGWQMYFDATDFTAKTGLTEIDGQHYIFDRNGTMPSTSGTPVVDGKKYWINPNGTLNTGWLALGKWIMYFDPVSYTARTGLTQIGDKHYIFNDDGVSMAAAGTPIYNGSKYCFNTDGSLRSGWITIGSWKMYFDTTTFKGAVGVSKIDNKLYVFDDNGILLTGSGTAIVNGKKYYFNADGSIQVGWVTLGNWKMYFNPSTGAAVTGVSQVEGKQYVFDENGIWLTGQGTQVIGGKKYCFNSDNTVRTGWVTIGNWKFYFDPSTGAGRTGFSTIGGVRYYFDSNCVMATGAISISGTYYYFNDDGSMVVNAWKVVNGQNMYFDSQGKGSTNYSGPYLLKVDRTNCVVTAYAQDNSGNYTIAVKSMLCSVGLSGTPTPSGTFHTLQKFRLKELMGPSWGKWATRVTDGIYFHSVATGSASDPTHNVPPAEFNKLGQPASHGCIRLCVRDAKWIYDNCSLGTTVVIGDNFALPFGIPTLPKITGGVDPTDPEA
ncbi:MAG: L,D-transpeptidase family protein [Lachnospiraceae bacterium]|nr:L,D-transpeptidase family protein [Lachnospiraceae bacterium]